MKENVFDNPVEVRSAVRPPRFEDQRVVSRAQRVVPLDEIRTKVRLRRVWFLSGAFAIAMLLGVASALVAVRLKSTTATQPESNNAAAVEAVITTQAEPQMEPASHVEEEAPAELEPELEPEPEVKPAVKKPTPAPEKPRVVAREYEPLEPERRRGEPSEEEQLEQIRESVLYERWQERRARRAERRERRRNRDDRDLSRVDELFEGPRRRERPQY